MAKKQKSFAEKAAGQGGVDATWVKYVKSVKSEQTGKYRFNEQMIGLQGGESLDAALKRLDETSNLVDIDLSEFIAQQSEEIVEEVNEVESKEDVVVTEESDPVSEGTDEEDSEVSESAPADDQKESLED
ncbi:MAG: DUF4295 family protein [Candidatus Marinimicrobia bacterium]|jgi:hypothetical protein|nr:DUF4295 family protein [Candidatus Neomarinimicrobiota bacterium]MBT3937562.1 DUF4295 family protein [Candidatus Neomarinimicrobiota bacterium]MBT3960731.1 DUF4295 family protein [Candidatus Neomarinimicrobiota bacterium]MBT4382977.1 DUF4295 family protein [Candidatus Neomarinimicrobiota bacterium]MBT4635121.1 DUF4295 family protein [Candidatus Neomarinimicrobiota bacterium]